MILPEKEQDQIELIHDTVMTHFKGSKELARHWFETGNVFLHGHTPVKEIRTGNIEGVFEALKKLVEME